MRTCDPTRPICASMSLSPRSPTPRAGTGLSTRPRAQRPQRPRRSAALEAEQAEALGRLIATPPIAAPQQESGHAYVRWADGVTYICPWQTRLRSWLELARLRSTARPLLATAFAAGQADERAAGLRPLAGPGRPRCGCSSRRAPGRCPPRGSCRSLPEERWLVLGGAGDPEPAGPATAAATRTLIYATAMSQARRRVARALNALRRTGGDALTEPARRGGRRRRPASPAAGTARARGRPRWRSPRSAGGWRNSIRIRSWNSITAVSCTCSTTIRCGLISRSRRCRRPSAPAGKASQTWLACSTSGSAAGGGRWSRSKPPTDYQRTTFQIPPVATIRVARITQRDA